MVNSKVKVDGQSRRKSIEDSQKDSHLNPDAIEEVSLDDETGEEVIISKKNHQSSSKKRKAKGADNQDEDQHQHRPKRRSRAGKYGKRLHGSRSRSPTISISSNSSGGSISITNSVNSSSVTKSNNSKCTLKKTSSRNNKKSTTATVKPRKARTGSSKKTAKSTSNNSKSFNFNLKIRQMNSILKKAKSTTKTTRKLSPSATKTSADPETRASKSPSHNRNDSGVDESPALSGNESDTSPETSSKEIITTAATAVVSGEENEIPGTSLSSDDVTSNDSGIKGNVTIIHDLKICAKSCKCPPPVVWFKCPFCTRVYDSLEKVRDHRISLHEVNHTHSETLRDNKDGRDNLNVDEKQDLSSDSDEEERLQYVKKKVHKGKATAPRQGSKSESDEEPRDLSSVPVIKPKRKPTPASPSRNGKGMLHKQKQRRRLSGTGESKPNGW